MILVTGGAGFIGSMLIKELNRKGRKDIIIVDRLRNSSKWKNLRGLKFAEYIHSDNFFVDDKKNNELDSYFLSRISLIVHLGACTSTVEADMDYLMKNNVDYSKKLFYLAKHNGIPFIYSSSAATYGDGSKSYSDDHKKISELFPLNRYGYSKQLFDEWMLTRDTRHMVWFGLKLFNCYGPNEEHKGEMKSVVSKCYDQIRLSGTVRLFKADRSDCEHGDQRRDFIYVKDAVKVLIMLMETDDDSKSGIYNVGTGIARTYNDMAHAVFDALNIKPKIKYVNLPENIKESYQYHTQADMQKFKDNLFPDFTFTHLEDGVADYVLNHLARNNYQFNGY